MSDFNRLDTEEELSDKGNNNALSLAPAWKRVASYIVDTVFLTIIMVLLLSVFLGKQISALPLNGDFQQQLSVIQTFYYRYMTQMVLGSLILQLSYFTLFWKMGQTLGAKLFKIAVRSKNLHQLSIPASLGRAMILFLCAQALYIPFLFVINPSLQQRIHDFFSQSVVIDITYFEKEEEEEKSSGITRL